jgi:FeS assembly ATPase SufC/FeS assembly protein SufD
MGPNGAGKSTLASVLAGREEYEITDGSVDFDGKDLLELATEDRAREGMFLAFQYPVEIPGVSNVNFMKTALNEIREYRGQEPILAKDFLALVKEKSKIVELDAKLASRSVNEGFSGGEKKRNEIFQMAMLDPKLAILDETDSGLDIDALRIVANGVNTLKSKDNATIVITHYQRLLDYIVPDFVHVLFDGKIVKTGPKELALELEEKGYDWIKAEVEKQIPLESEIFSALNTYYAQDGIGIRIAKKTELKQSIQVIFISTGEYSYSGARNVISCEDFASAHIVLNYMSLDSNTTFNNSLTEIHVGTNANLTIDKIQQEVDSSLNITSEFVNQEKDSTFTINTITLDGALVRNNLTIAVDGQNSETNLSGAYVLKGKQHVDNHTVVDHKVAHCQSNELYKGVIDDQATAVFNGKVFVRKDAQKINAFQSNGNVLLSDNATINSKPELEIYADDVKCSHGSTTGQLDEEAIFYLRARGISEKGARALMVSAFIGDVIEKIEMRLFKNTFT